MKFHARRYDTREPVCIEISGEQIESVTPLSSSQQSISSEEVSSEELPIVAPAFYDLQINGHGGIWFGQPEITVSEVLTALQPHHAFGVTRMFPTLITNSDENLLHGFHTLREACEQEKWADQLVAGCHLEGPYLSPEDGPRGAHPREHIRPPDWEEFQHWQEASGGRIRLVTVAPEIEGAIDFIRRAVESGVVCSIGHTASDPEHIEQAVDAGARMSTHLGNGAHGTIRRHPNYIWEQLANDSLIAGLITDGHHLPASVVKCMVRAKGAENCIITCDASGLAGCPPGLYEEAGVEIEVLHDGRVVMAGQRQFLAGSGASTWDCVRWAAKQPEIELSAACDMAGNQVARLFSDQEILIEAGNPAELVLLEQSLEADRIDLIATISRGRLSYGQLSH